MLPLRRILAASLRLPSAQCLGLARRGLAARANVKDTPLFSDGGNLSGFSSRPHQPILIEGGTLIDGTGAPAQPNRALLVHGDKILALGDAAVTRARELDSTQQSVEEKVQRVNASGLFVLPGLIDSHCHISFGEPQSNDELFFHRQNEALTGLIAAHNVKKLLLSGCTGFFDADVLFNIGCDLRDAIEIGATDGPRMVTGGNAFLTTVGGTAGRLIPEEGVRGYAQVVRTGDEIVQTVRRQIKYGADWIKIHASGFVPRHVGRGEICVWTREELRLAVETAHSLHTPVVAHCRDSTSTRDCAKAGVDLLYHATNMNEEALDAVLEAGVPICPSLTFQANLADYGDSAGASPALQDLFRKEIASSSVMLKRAYDAGIPFMCGSESGFSITPYGHWHGREIEVFVKHLGLTPLQAISCATKENGRALRLDGKVGVLQEGMLADIIVVDGDPVKDVRVLNDRTRLRHVVSKGKQVDLNVPWPTRAPFYGEKVGVWTAVPLTQEVAQRFDKETSSSK